MFRTLRYVRIACQHLNDIIHFFRYAKFCGVWIGGCNTQYTVPTKHTPPYVPPGPNLSFDPFGLAIHAHRFALYGGMERRDRYRGALRRYTLDEIGEG